MDPQSSKGRKVKMKTQTYKTLSPQETFEIAGRFGEKLTGGEVVLLSGDLGAGKTIFTKGILNALEYDIDEVTSPSFTLVNLYKTEKRDVFHIDFWRLDESVDVALAVGLDEILDDERSVVIIEWADKLGNFSFDRRVFSVRIDGDGDEPRQIEITQQL